ncbi:binding-protein-dependent transport systems inner membrane component [Candidatus Vecturithrix granuli]|uniref:Binding-protein-dependent transport systems inner membrane component n=1 Tax=Vecturithrix granuli TaxID=1499967 RepID=A0A081BZ06_VECG1|nr:binding-protein-dependent transport systems inner membrane component [Candidatus Vecturithrix granuli]
MKIKDRYMWIPFVLPGVLLLVLVLGFPAVTSILYSFEPEGDRGSYTLANYINLLQDPFFKTTFWNTGVFVFFSVASHLVLGLAVALVLNTALPAKPLFRIIALLPWVVPDVVAGIIWKWMYNPLYGAINDLLLRTGLIHNPVEWLTKPQLALFSVILVNLWRGFPFVMLILLAGLQSIPNYLYEAAAIDGASARQSFFHITIPGLRKMLVVALALDTVWEVRRFGLIQAMTQGGPGVLTEVLSTYTYKQYFKFFRFEYASAISVVMTLVLLLVSLPYIWMISQEE